MKNDWTLDGKKFTSDDIGDFYGYVYRITNLVSGHDYIGRKYFNTVRKLNPLKGFKRKRKVTKETDWQEYWGSSKRLLEDIEKLGKANFKREIICLCETRGDTNYMEAKIQFDEEVLLNPNNYNGIIAIKLGYGSVKNLSEKYVQSRKNML
jgi:hypothetical protein|tara:strand:+ start:1703 stop:2155 length:453 start_codon:yes stop_codon:yes gene_type:complete